MSNQSSRARAWRTMPALLALGAALAASLVQAGKPIPPAAPPVQYTMTLVPLSNVTGMNNLGDMVDGSTRLYDHSTSLAHDLAGPVNGLLNTPDEGLAYVADLNDAWQITGGFLDSSGVVHAFRCALGYGEDGEIVASALERLPERAGYPFGLPEAINNSGDVAGYVATDINAPGEYRAVLWSSEGGVTELGNVFSRAYDISDRDATSGAVKVAGSLYLRAEQRAFLYDSLSGTMKDLGVLSRRTTSEGFAVNSSGQVAGKSYGGGRTEHSFRYTPGVGMVDLGTLGGSDYGNHAASLNAAGQVVGTAVTRLTNPFSVTGFLYTDANKMLDLARLIANPPASLEYFEPKAINDYPLHAFGQIAGPAYVNGQPAVILLTPDR